MIRIYQNDPKFEYDIRGLVLSFYPQIPQEVVTAEAPEGEFDLLVELSEEKVSVTAGEISKEAAFAPEDRREAKTTFKNLLYDVLVESTGKTVPWGTLTGIRPTKIPMELLEKGWNDEKILEQMEGVYRVSKEKSQLALDIAKEEREVLKDIDYENGYSLYIGIPFCPSTCLYCSFTSYPIGRYKNQVDAYLDAVFKEIDYTAEAFKDKKLNTIYFGGGTPTTLPAEAMDRLLTKVEESFDFSHLLEFTVEAGRPDSITREKFEVLKKHPVTRISINPQTMKAETLKIIGRNHTPQMVEDAFYMAREMGFDNINMDLIMGLPNETLEDVEMTLKKIAEMDPDNLTVHSLALKRTARLNLCRDQYQDLTFENSPEHMQLAADYAAKMNMVPYYLYRQKNIAGNQENTGYARKGKAGIYNILIMEEKQTIVALGAGSSTKAVFPGGRIERAENVKDIDQYLSRVDEMIERKKKLFEEWF